MESEEVNSSYEVAVKLLYNYLNTNQCIDYVQKFRYF